MVPVAHKVSVHYRILTSLFVKRRDDISLSTTTHQLADLLSMPITQVLYLWLHIISAGVYIKLLVRIRL